jgi:DNA polymerase-3 subunit delta'
MDKASDIEAESRKYTFSSLYKIITSIKKAGENIKSNVNYQLTIEIMLLNIQEG